MSLIVDAGLDGVTEGVSGGCLHILILIPESWGQASSHPVIVLAQIGHITTVTGASISWHQLINLLS